MASRLPVISADAIEPRSHLRQLGLGDAPFGLDAGVVGGRLGQRQLDGTGRALGILGLGGDLRPPRFVGGERLFAGFQLRLEPLECIGGIAGQPVGIATIRFELRLLPVEVGQALLGGFELMGQRRHPVAVRARIVAPVGELVARFGKRLGQ